uniref:Uncharacterized protein n=1 Tax=viral metagenome TaxID=1070528 RepID=A0A6H2A4Y0_9ZZZZ
MRAWLAVPIGLLVVYAPIELSRCILAWPPDKELFIAELFFIWGTYTIAIILLTLALLRR